MGKGVELGPYQAVALLPHAVVKGRGNGLAQLRFAYPGGAVKDEGKGALRLPFAGVGPQLEGGGHHGPLLAQNPVLEILIQRLKRSGHGGGATQRPKAVRHGLEAGKALNAPLGKEAAQAGIATGIGHGGTKIEQVACPVPPEAQPCLSGPAARRHLAGGKFIAAPKSGADIHPLLKQGRVAGETGAKLGKIHETASAVRFFRDYTHAAVKSTEKGIKKPAHRPAFWVQAYTSMYCPLAGAGTASSIFISSWPANS